MFRLAAAFLLSNIISYNSNAVGVPLLSEIKSTSEVKKHFDCLLVCRYGFEINGEVVTLI